jgi:hypothetical protein
MSDRFYFTVFHICFHLFFKKCTNIYLLPFHQQSPSDVLIYKPERSKASPNSLTSLAHNNNNNKNKPQDFTVVASSPIKHDSENTPLSY